jgi:hypothetical protein
MKEGEAVKLQPEQIDALHITETVKFICTADETGKVNVAPIISTDYYQEDTLIFGDFLMWKTKQNLLQDPRVAVLVVDQGLRYFKLRGTFLGFEEKGQAFDFMNNTPLFKYNAYTGVRSAGLIRIEAASGTRPISKLKMAGEFLWNAVQNSDYAMNPVVMEKYARLQSLKALAWMGEQGPEVSPVTVIRVAGDTMLFRSPDCPPAGPAALSVITMDPVTYQVKGQLERQNSRCLLRVEEVYAGGLPIPGRRIS